jgi:hypothetical protein
VGDRLVALHERRETEKQAAHQRRRPPYAQGTPQASVGRDARQQWRHRQGNVQRGDRTEQPGDWRKNDTESKDAGVVEHVQPVWHLLAVRQEQALAVG